MIKTTLPSLHSFDAVRNNFFRTPLISHTRVRSSLSNRCTSVIGTQPNDFVQTTRKGSHILSPPQSILNGVLGDVFATITTFRTLLWVYKVLEPTRESTTIEGIVRLLNWQTHITFENELPDSIVCFCCIIYYLLSPNLRVSPTIHAPDCNFCRTYINTLLRRVSTPWLPKATNFQDSGIQAPFIVITLF